MDSSKCEGRITNIILASMQMIVPMATQVALMINIIQQDEVSLITKSFVALRLVVSIDDMFASTLPQEILVNAYKLNSETKLKLSEDHNTYTKIFKRMSYSNLHVEIVNLNINLWYTAIVNF